ncbi:ABC transporter permease [Parabacteroides distasonis]
MIDNLAHGLRNMCDVWAEEIRRIMRDEGMLLFFIVLPLTYPILYSWVYNNEVVRDVPVVVVDDSRSQLSREFIRLCDGTADVEIVGYAADMDEARRSQCEAISALPP